MKIGTEIYYTGDMANHEDYGVIININPPDRWGGETYDIKLNDGRVWRGIYKNSFANGPGKRFWLADEWDADKKRRISEMMARIKHSD